MDLTAAQVGGNVSTAEIANLPSGNGNFTGLIAILPGVVYNRASDGQSDNVTINGQPGTGVVYQLDGGSNNDDLRGGSAGAQTRPALESIQEFQVVTNQFDAEFGAALSGVVNAVTKQGTNTYHGSLIGFFTNAAMTSKDILSEQAGGVKPETQNMRYGVTLGGPIVRDRMHYFVGYEKQDRDEGRSFSYVTRPDMSFSTAPANAHAERHRPPRSSAEQQQSLFGPLPLGSSTDHRSAARQPDRGDAQSGQGQRLDTRRELQPA